jgi:hypothetical protein
MLRRKWDRLKSGLYIPPFLKRLHKDEFGGWPPCPDCCGSGPAECGCDEPAPNQAQIVLAGFGGSGDCADLNDTYVTDETSTCWYQYSFSPRIEYVDRIRVFLHPISTNLRVTVYLDLYEGVPLGWIEFEQDFGTTPADCRLTDEDVPLKSMPAWWQCTAGSGAATCTYTAIYA